MCSECNKIINTSTKQTQNNMRLHKMLDNLTKSILPTSTELIYLLNECKTISLSEPNIINIKINEKSEESSIRIYGDIHGQFYDLLSTFDTPLHNINEYKLFLGDYVDRGMNSIEVMILILCLKVLDRNKTIILRGNHEFEEITVFYGFQTECLEKYDLYMFEKFVDLFKYMPVCAILEVEKSINKEITRYFCVHGGITNTEELLENIEMEDRTRPSKHMMDLFWSDPRADEIIQSTDNTSKKDGKGPEELTEKSKEKENHGFESNPRGAGVLFGKEPFLKFLEKYNFDYMVRSHQLSMEGFKEYYDGKLLLVWSAPNYGYRQGNKASYIYIDAKKGNGYDVVYFNKVPEQYKKNLPVDCVTVDFVRLDG